MAVAFGSAGTLQNFSTASTSWAVPYPTGITAGDLLILHVVTNGGALSSTPPTGWTEVFRPAGVTNPKGGVYYKVASGSETGNVTVTTASTTGVAGIVRYTGVDTTTPMDVAAGTVEVNTTGDLTATLPSITTVTNGAMLVMAAAANSTSKQWTGPGGTTKRVDFTATLGTSKSGSLFDETVATAGATGTRDLSMTSPGVAHWGVIMALRPGSGGPPPGTGTLTQRVVGIPASPTTNGLVQVKVASTSSARLICSTDSAQTTGVVYGSAVTPDADGNARLTVSGLTPNTRYYYRVEMTDASSNISIDNAATIGRLKTAPSGQASFAFDFGSCANSTDPIVFPLITARNDDMFFHLGDMFYNDGSGTTVANLRSKLNGKITQTNHAALYAQVNMAHVPGDHDVATNDTVNATDPTAWANYRQVSNELFPDPALYYTFVWGRVRFIKIDTMNYKDDPTLTDNSSKSALGATQKQWLKDTITAATEPVIVIIQADPWIGSFIANDTGWFSYITERTELANFFSGSGKNIAIIGGDMHSAAADDGTNSPGGVAFFSGSPFGQTASQKGGPYTTGPIPASGTAFTTQYGRMVVTDSGSSIQLGFNAYDSTNASVLSLTKTYTLGTTASPTGIAGSEAFGSPAVSTTVTASPTGIASAQALGTPAVSALLVTLPAGVATGQAFGAPAISTAVTASPTGIASAQAMGSPTIATALTASPAGIASGEAAGAPAVATILTASPSGIATAQTFGTPVVGGNLTAAPAGIATAQAFGTPSIATTQTVTVTGIASTEALGAPSVAMPITASPAGITTAEAFGVPRAAGSTTYSPDGIPTEEAFGTPALAATLTTSPAGIATAAAFGSPAVTVQDLNQTASPAGIPTAVAFGAPNIIGNRVVSPPGIGSLESFGTPSQSNVLVVLPANLPSRGTAFGSPSIKTLLTAAPGGIATQQAMGQPTIIKVVLHVGPAGIASLESFGAPKAIGGSGITPYEMAGAMLSRRYSGRLTAPENTTNKPNRWEGTLG